MGKTWPKLIRDPVHDIISFEDNDCDRLLLDLINTGEFQRLRRIKQLGMSELVFPGANHSRFAHSIGVMHNTRRFIARIEQLTGQGVDPHHRTCVLAAALLHDIGHGPFSHTFEKITGESHEAKTKAIIRGETGVSGILCKHDKNLPDNLCQFFDEGPDAASNGIPKYFTQIISSQLDADRFDYLLRDSHASGAAYGQFDSKWLIQHLRLDGAKGRLHLSNKALVAVETYIYARYHMYRAVYYHKTTRAAEVMLRLLFGRFSTLLKDGADASKFSPGAPPAVVKAFAPNIALGLADYLSLDDHTVTELVKCSRNGNDPELAALAAGILERKLYKSIDASDAQMVGVGDFQQKAAELIRRKNPKVDIATALVNDTPADTPYKPYDPDADQPATQIYIENSLGAVKELGQLSAGARALGVEYRLLRYYFPVEFKDDIELVAKECLKKG